MNPGFFQTVCILLKAARKRTIGRIRHQKELRQKKTGRASSSLHRLSFFLMFFVGFMIHFAAAFAIQSVVKEARLISLEKQGKIVVSRSFYSDVSNFKQAETDSSGRPIDHHAHLSYSWESDRRAERFGGSEQKQEAFLRSAVEENPLSAFAVEDDPAFSFRASALTDSFAATLGTLILLWWFITLSLQGENQGLDFQRRRHPMWEWLFSHPVSPGAVFLAEMLTPFAANPAYLTAPIFIGLLFGFAYGPILGFLSLFIIGVPVALAAACLGKAQEISIILRASLRSRGVFIGFLNWLGHIGMFFFIICMNSAPAIVRMAGATAYSLMHSFPLHLLNWILGATSDGTLYFLRGLLSCWLLCILIIGVSVGISIWSTKKGLAGNTTNTQPSKENLKGFDKKRNPLYRKEMLWFIRDRSAIIQVILVPLTIVGFQLFNMRHLLENNRGSWSMPAGITVIFGTYFLWIIGPKSLASEGSALWIAQSWPYGLEKLLKTKAKLWFLISSALVLTALCIIALLFPADGWKLAFVGIAWLAFGRSMAEKTVTLVSVPSSSGEPAPRSRSRILAASLGVLTFSIGVFTRQWQLVVIGTVYSWITAAALWQNLRARLPYLYDPWSEELPKPPTVMHAMISVSMLIECGAIFAALFAATGLQRNTAIAQSIAYTLTAAAVMYVTTIVLNNRNLPPECIWTWKDSPSPRPKQRDLKRFCRYIKLLLSGTICGLALALLAHVYLICIEQIGPLGEMIRLSRDQLNQNPGLRHSYFFIAVCVAPFAEEFLFRGLFFRALDKEWGGWKALLGSSAFFVIYHPPISWLPVGVLGVLNAYIFKKTGRLAPAVALHMVYNAVVLAW
ncbi:MAG: CPBP family intramembrane metalloprotease [Lentisphaerae bacterium]|nr:CPBP family intramembrane metalloprotease [Lentisphaerota bacterium]